MTYDTFYFPYNSCTTSDLKSANSIDRYFQIEHNLTNQQRYK